MQNFPSEILEKIRVTLENQKRDLEARIDTLKAQDPFTDPDRINDNAASDMEATEEANHDRLEAVMQELSEKISEIDAALMRIGSGAYGICTSCGNVIETDRLNILPTATLCLSCEKKVKKKLQV